MALQHVSKELLTSFNLVKSYLPMVGWGLGILWAVNIVNWVFLRSGLNWLSIHPRHVIGLSGILFGPIFHANFEHLLFNSIPAFFLVCFTLTYGPYVFVAVTIVSWLGSGVLLWLLGRNALHLGMSSVVTGYFGFLLVEAFRAPGLIPILLAIAMIYYFGSIFFGLFPQAERISWEGHLFGFISGIAASFLLPTIFYYFVLWSA